MRRPPPARLVALKRPAEQRRVFGGDRQTQPAAPTVARGVGLVEPLEDPLEPVRRDAGAAIRHRQRDRVAVCRERHLDRRTSRVLAGVVEEVAEDPLEPARVGLDHERLIGESERGLRKPGRGDRRDQPAQIDRLERDLLGPRIEPGHLHQVVDQRPKPADVAHQQLAGPPALRRQLVEVLAQDRRLGDQGRQRRSQFVGDIGDEAPVLGLGRLQSPDRVAQGLGHPVESLRPTSRTRRSR